MNVIVEMPKPKPSELSFSQLENLIKEQGGIKPTARYLGCSPAAIRKARKKNHRILYEIANKMRFTQGISEEEMLQIFKQDEAKVQDALETLSNEYGLNIHLSNVKGQKVYTLIRQTQVEDKISCLEPLETLPKDEFLFTFGVIGDTQLGSKYQQLTALNEFYDICQNRGVPVVYHTGDVMDGENMYKGHIYELFLHGEDEQVEYVVVNYPRREGVTTKFIGGNHDLCYVRIAGSDPGRKIAAARDDMQYLGQYGSYVFLQSQDGQPIKIYLLHPDGGEAYAISYRIQKIIEGFEDESKPQLLFVGHFHTAELIPSYRGVTAYQSGGFQSQTPFFKRRGKEPVVGGWICTVKTRNGFITSMQAEFFRWKYKEKDY